MGLHNYGSSTECVVNREQVHHRLYNLYNYTRDTNTTTTTNKTKNRKQKPVILVYSSN